MPRNGKDISAQHHHSAQENETNQIALNRRANFINGHIQSIHKQDEADKKKTILLDKQMMDPSRVINEQASGKFEAEAQAMDMGEMKIENGVNTRNLRSVENPKAEIMRRRIYGRYRGKIKI